ncbi:hypothetical protein [Nocardia crassostreae]|uniref:hypothetical protein n=1 Tax=Nocardia crassostreae TaxID=53428 RepID=UPI00083106B9|nr:hypothetical protein [Nocardia crassostreae]
MNDPAIDAVPEADYVEQNMPAYPDDGVDSEESAADDAVPPGDSGWTADEGDLVEQSIPVPLDDDYDEAADSGY